MIQSDFDVLFPEGIIPNRTIPFIQKGKWAIHELLPFFVASMGLIDVRIATFNISEDSLRPLFFMNEDGKLKSLKLLLDMNVKRHKLDLLLFAANITPTIKLSSTHMKLLLVNADSLNIVVMGSANLNNNPRYEAGIISTDNILFGYYSEAYNRIFENDSLPFYGIEQ